MFYLKKFKYDLPPYGDLPVLMRIRLSLRPVNDRVPCVVGRFARSLGSRRNIRIGESSHGRRAHDSTSMGSKKEKRKKEDNIYLLIFICP